MLNSWTDSRVKWYIDTFKYDGLKDSKSTNSKASDTSKGPTTKEGDAVGSFITCSSFSSNQEFKLYNAWTLDNASDIHVCNDNQRSSFQKTSDATSKDELFAGKTSYPIEAFGTATVPVQTPDGMRTIILTNV